MQIFIEKYTFIYVLQMKVDKVPRGTW